LADRPDRKDGALFQMFKGLGGGAGGERSAKSHTTPLIDYDFSSMRATPKSKDTFEHIIID